MFKPNIDFRGRLVRAIGGLSLILAAVFIWPVSVIASAGVGAGGVFMIFEAGRGWCAVRACGIRTPL